MEINAAAFTATVTVEPDKFDVKKAVAALAASEFAPNKVEDVSSSDSPAPAAKTDAKEDA